MALEKQTVTDKIEVMENGVVQVRESVRVLEDGNILSNSFNRYVVTPGSDYSTRDAKVQAICAAVFTPEVIAAYKASIAPW